LWQNANVVNGPIRPSVDGTVPVKRLLHKARFVRLELPTPQVLGIGPVNTFGPESRLLFAHRVSKKMKSLINDGIEPVRKFEPMSTTLRCGELVTQELGMGPVNWLKYR